MTTSPEQWGKNTFSSEEDRTGEASCHMAVNLDNPMEEALVTPRSTRVLIPEYDVTALVITTHKDRITFPLDIKWEIRRVMNLLANKVRPPSATRPEEQGPAIITCSYEIR